MVKVKLPFVVGEPLRMPLLLRERPSGSEPVVRVKTRVPMPPVVAIVPLYACPFRPAVREVVVIASGAATVTGTSKVLVTPPPVAVRLTVEAPIGVVLPAVMENMAELPLVVGVTGDVVITAVAPLGSVPQVMATGVLKLLVAVRVTMAWRVSPCTTAIAPEVILKLGAGANTAATLFAVLMVTWQVPVPLQSPVQPVKMLPLSGVAVRVMTVP